MQTAALTGLIINWFKLVMSLPINMDPKGIERVLAAIPESYLTPFARAWRHRELIRAVVRREYLSRFSGSMLGWLWAVGARLRRGPGPAMRAAPPVWLRLQDNKNTNKKSAHKVAPCRRRPAARQSPQPQRKASDAGQRSGSGRLVRAATWQYA